MFVNSDFSDLLKTFNDKNVKYNDAWERRNTIQFDDVDVTFIAKEDLITAKRAADRPQDLLDAKSLSQSSDS